ncbi:MAG: protealysin inhibitor emfourin [Leifsonia flava]
MLVIVTRSGGFGGLRRTWSVLVDEQPDAAAWLVLLAELPWDDVPPQPPQPDRFVYVIRYERQSGAPADLDHTHVHAPTDRPDPPEREATLAEQQLQGPWRELVDRVRTADSTTGPDPRPTPDSHAAH